MVVESEQAPRWVPGPVPWAPSARVSSPEALARAQQQALVEAARSRTEVIVGLVRREKPTLRQLLGYMAGARGHYVTSGTPEQIADLMADWFQNGAADGFNLMPPILPAMLEAFIDQVVPLLRRRGLFRSEYTADTLRGHYGLHRPALGA